MPNGRERVEALRQKITDSPGMTFLQRMHARSFSLNVFRMSVRELQAAFTAFQTPEIGIKLMDVTNEEVGWQAEREIGRLLHNFVASAMTLRDHTRIFFEENYGRTPLGQLYDEKIKADIANDEVCRFIQDLRNYMLHRGFPQPQRHMSWHHERGIATGVQFRKDELEG